MQESWEGSYEETEHQRIWIYTTVSRNHTSADYSLCSSLYLFFQCIYSISKPSFGFRLFLSCSTANSKKASHTLLVWHALFVHWFLMVCIKSSLAPRQVATSINIWFFCHFLPYPALSCLQGLHGRNSTTLPTLITQEADLPAQDLTPTSQLGHPTSKSWEVSSWSKSDPSAMQRDLKISQVNHKSIRCSLAFTERMCSGSELKPPGESKPTATALSNIWTNEE